MAPECIKKAAREIVYRGGVDDWSPEMGDDHPLIVRAIAAVQRAADEYAAEQCEAIPVPPDFARAVEAMVLWFDAENDDLGTFHDKMDLCKYAEWCARRALGQEVGEFEGVPRLVLVLAEHPTK